MTVRVAQGRVYVVATSVPSTTGTVARTLGAVTSSASGAVPPVGTSAVTLAALVSAGTGGLPVRHSVGLRGHWRPSLSLHGTIPG